MTKAKQGHLPGCMCPNCKESSFARAVGTEGTSEAKSLNAAALFAYQHEQEALGGPREDEPDFAFGDKKGKGKGKPLVLPQGELLPEVKAFCSRFALTDRLTTKVMDTLRKRGDPEWRHDLAEMNRDLSKARNPSGLLVVKLGDLQKELNPNQLCFNYRAGTCTWGDKCRWSHDVAVGAERMKTSALLAAAAKGTMASLPTPAVDPSVQPGFGSDGAGKVDKILRRNQRRSPSAERVPSPPRNDFPREPLRRNPSRERCQRDEARSPRDSFRDDRGRDRQGLHDLSGPRNRDRDGPPRERDGRDGYPPRESYRSPPRDGYRSPPRDGYSGPPRDGYSGPPRDGYRSPPRDGYRSPPRDGYRSPPRDYRSPPRDGYRSPPRDGYRSPPRDERYRDRGDSFRERNDREPLRRSRSPRARRRGW
ncbi:unnamed protein product, partial [Effrenium voratum]